MEKDASKLSLKELLVQIKDLVEIQLDLAYSAVLYDDIEAAKQVMELESKITEYLGYVIVRAIMAGRDLSLAKKLLALIRFASALEDVSNAAADIAELTVERISLGSFKNVLMHADEVTIRIRVSNKRAHGVSIDNIEKEVGMRIVAVRRGKKWILNPPGDFIVWMGDILYLTGPEERIDEAQQFLGLEEKGENLAFSPKIAEYLKNFFDVLVSLKYTAETSIALSYYALLTGDKVLAEEVKHLEQWVDYMRDVMDVYALKMSRHFDEIDALRGFFRIIDATEEITDSAYKLAQIVFSNVDVASLFRVIFDKADEKIVSLTITKNSKLAYKTIAQIDLEDHYGVFLLGIRRKRQWFFDPEDNFEIRPGDVLIVRGPMAAISRLIVDVTNEKPNGSI